MIKSATSALAILVAVAGLAAPAAAESLVDQGSDNEHFNETIVLHQLREKGIDAGDLAYFNGRIRATVRHDDGSFTFAYFEPGTLEQVSPSGDGRGNRRVLSERDVGAAVAPLHTVPQSLVGENADDEDN